MGNVILTLSVVVLALLCMHHCSARGLRLGPIGPEGHLQVTLSYVLKWSTGMCEICHGDTCCQTVMCLFLGPCIAYGQLAQKNEYGGFCGGCLLAELAPCFVCIWAADNRRHLRKKYNLPAEPCNDCCVHCWCFPCATCQELRQLNEPLPGVNQGHGQIPINSNQVKPE